jgi:hypothetical protein
MASTVPPESDEERLKRKYNEMKTERTNEIAKNYLWREGHVGKDGIKLVDGTMTRTTPQKRDWLWCFTALYSSSRSMNFSNRGYKLNVRMMETVFFHKGKPVKWLGTSDKDGFIVRRSLANTWTARADTTFRQTGGARYVQIFLYMFVDYDVFFLVLL